MPNPATVRERRLRKTKAQLIDEIDTLEQRAAAIEAANRSSAPMRAKASDRYLANQELAHLARLPSENPNPVLTVMPDGTVLYANDAATAVNGLLKGRKKSTLARDLGGVCAEASRAAEAQETEFESGDCVFAFSIAPVAGETYINIYGRDITAEHLAQQERRSAEARLRDAIGIMYDSVAVFDSEGRLVHCNNTFRDIYQYSEADTELGVATYDSLGQVDAAHGTHGYQPLSFAQRLAKARQAGSTEIIQFIGDRILERPKTIHQVTEALEELMHDDAVAGRPFIASLAISKIRGGLPAPGFFACARRLGRFVGDEGGSDARAFYASEFNAAVAFWGGDGWS